MNKTFLEATEVAVVKGYLSKVDESGKVVPVYNKAFVDAQKQAEWVVLFAEKIKGKDFVGKAPDDVESIKRKVTNLVNKKENVKYVESPKAKKGKLHKQLAEETLKWFKDTENSKKTAKINQFLQRFNAIKEFEEIGLFFEDNIVKLNKIYTIEEIVTAVNTEGFIDLIVQGK